MSAGDAGLEVRRPRLRLALGGPGDAAAVADYQARNRAHFARWDPVRPEAFFTEAFWAEQLAQDQEAASRDERYRLWVRPSSEPDRVVGHVHFANVVRGAFQACHVGFGVDQAHEGEGLMREALEAAVELAFGRLGLHRIEANHRPENVRSGLLLKRLGFAPQGYARDYLRIDGQWRDHVLTALTNPAWRA